jgi:hypothetical protein
MNSNSIRVCINQIITSPYAMCTHIYMQIYQKIVHIAARLMAGFDRLQ